MLPHKGALAHLADQEILLLQLLHRFAHRDTADLIGLAQLRLRGQAAAGGISAFVDFVPQLLV